MKGTIFEDSATSLKLWFYAIYIMSSTRCGISAKQLGRELGVTYKTAWRMFHPCERCWKKRMANCSLAKSKPTKVFMVERKEQTP